MYFFPPRSSYRTSYSSKCHNGDQTWTETGRSWHPHLTGTQLQRYKQWSSPGGANVADDARDLTPTVHSTKAVQL